MERGKAGRPSKGERRQLKVRVPVPLFDALHVEAARRGMSLNDYLGELFARETGTAYSNQEALPLTA